MDPFTIGLIVAGGIALVAGATGIWGSLEDDKRARDEAAREKEYVEEMYEINSERAAEEFAAAKEQAERNAAQAEKQADLTDRSLDVTEQGLSNDFNAAIDQLYLSQTSDTYSWNNDAMQAGSSEGAAYANLAGSGVRAGSSLSDAVLMESATNAAQLQFSQDAKRRSDDNNLAGVLNNLAGNRWNIQQSRIGADYMRDDARYLRNSYQEGGHNWNLYQNQLKSLETTADYNITRANYEYEQHSGWNSFANSMMAFTSMSSKGFQTGYSTYNNVYKSMEYK